LDDTFASRSPTVAFAVALGGSYHFAYLEVAMRTSKFPLALALLCLIALLGMCVKESNAVPPKYGTHYSSQMQVQYEVVPQGFKLLADSPFAFDDGYVATANDVVVRVGNEKAGGGKTLDGMITRAKNAGNRFMVIIDCNDGRQYSHQF